MLRSCFTQRSLTTSQTLPHWRVRHVQLNLPSAIPRRGAPQSFSTLASHRPSSSSRPNVLPERHSSRAGTYGEPHVRHMASLRRIVARAADLRSSRGQRRGFASGKSSDSSQKTQYEVLGVPHDATPEVIKQRYLELAKLYHPEVSGDPNTAERFEEVSTAFAILSNEVHRARYDMALASGATPEEAAASLEEHQGAIDPLEVFQHAMSEIGFQDMDKYFTQLKADAEIAVHEIKANRNFAPARKFAMDHKFLIGSVVAPLILLFRFPALALAGLRVVAAGATGAIGIAAQSPAARAYMGRFLANYYVALLHRRREEKEQADRDAAAAAAKTEASAQQAGASVSEPANDSSTSTSSTSSSSSSSASSSASSASSSTSGVMSQASAAQPVSTPVMSATASITKANHSGEGATDDKTSASEGEAKDSTAAGTGSSARTSASGRTASDPNSSVKT